MAARETRRFIVTVRMLSLSDLCNMPARKAIPGKQRPRPASRGITGLSPSTWIRLEGAGLAPKRRRMSGNRVGWREDEVQAWLEAREVAAPAGK